MPSSVAHHAWSWVGKRPDPDTPILAGEVLKSSAEDVSPMMAYDILSSRVLLTLFYYT